MKEITATGPTVEEAVQSALAQLNTSKDRAEITIVEEGKKGSSDCLALNRISLLSN